MKQNHKKEKLKNGNSENDEFYASEEQGILSEESSEEILQDMESGEKDEDPDTPEGREKLVEDDEVADWEAGFSEGANEEGQLAKDALTGEPLMDVDDVVETKIDGRLYRFVNKVNAQKFREKKRKENLE